MGSKTLLNQRSNHNASDEVERPGHRGHRRYHPTGFRQRAVRFQGLRGRQRSAAAEQKLADATSEDVVNALLQKKLDLVKEVTELCDADIDFTKSDIEIKDDIYKHIKGSLLEKVVNGKLCKASKRPSNSDREDIVISILENGSGQIQEAFVNVNIYVKDNIRNGEAEMNDARCRELCKVAIQVLETGHGESYRFTLNKQRVLEVNGKNEHFINNKLLYSFNNE